MAIANGVIRITIFADGKYLGRYQHYAFLNEADDGSPFVSSQIGSQYWSPTRAAQILEATRYFATHLVELEQSDCPDTPASHKRVRYEVQAIFAYVKRVLSLADSASISNPSFSVQHGAVDFWPQQTSSIMSVDDLRAEDTAKQCRREQYLKLKQEFQGE